MKTIKPSQIKANDCLLFEHRGSTVRRVSKVEHDEAFATPSGGGDLFVVHFEPRDELPDRAEYPPHVDVRVLDESDLGDVFAAGCDLVRQFAEATMPDDAEVDAAELMRNTPAELREIFEHATDA